VGRTAHVQESGGGTAFSSSEDAWQCKECLQSLARPIRPRFKAQCTLCRHLGLSPRVSLCWEGPPEGVWCSVQAALVTILGSMLLASACLASIITQ